MTCPHCGSSVQPGDHFCASCGHSLTPTGSTHPLQTANESTYGEQPLVEAAPYAPAPPSYEPRVVESPPEKSWATGSSFPAPNPYADWPAPPPPAPLNNGPVFNGRPYYGGYGRGVRRSGAGGSIAAVLIGAIIATSVFHLWLLWPFFLLIVLFILGSMMRGRP